MMTAEEANNILRALKGGDTNFSHKQILCACDTLNNVGAATILPPNDPVHHPKHYTSHPSGIECIQVTEHMGFNIGNAVKYLWRADLKNDAVEDLRKAKWYIERELLKRGVK